MICAQCSFRVLGLRKYADTSFRYSLFRGLSISVTNVGSFFKLVDSWTIYPYTFGYLNFKFMI